jgi:GNAT superfamily N-acetyltransferase
MNNEVRITIETEPSDADLRTFWNFLRAHNLQHAGSPNHEKVCLIARDENEKIIGGLNGDTYWGWLFVENLAVDEDQRGNDVGSKLLQTAEEEARNRGCYGAYLDTFSFQALPFYEKQGYEVFGILDDFPPGHKRFFLQKRL